jgi:uncharacterized protein
MKQNKIVIVKIIISFAILFLLYHLAEFLILFKKSTLGFLIFQLLFFTAAYILGNWSNKTGLSFWGLPFSKKILKYSLIGIPLGIVLYAITFLSSLVLGVEFITGMPDLTAVIETSLPFILGVIFSSFSEDILTRGIVFRLLKDRLKNVWIILISSGIYLLNHIYRLNDGYDTLLYIFLLGIVLIIPLIYTKNLWVTGFMHWTGNCFFFVTNNAIQTDTNISLIKPNLLFAFWIMLYIPIVWLICKKLNRFFEKETISE